MKDSLVINRVSFITLISRLLIAFALLLFWFLGGFRDDELKGLAIVLGPLTCLFFTAFLGFAVNHPYAIFRNQLDLSESKIMIWLPIVMYAGYISLIVCCALSRDYFSFESLTNILFFGELILSIYSATFLGSLFQKWE